MTSGPEQWREFYGDRPGWVFSHREMPTIPGVDLHVVSGDVRPVLDEVWLGMTPVTLGAGAPLLPRRITSERMRFREVRRSGQRVRLVLDVVRPG